MSDRSAIPSIFRLQQQIEALLSLEDLRTLCLGLQLDYDNLEARGKSNQVTEILEKMVGASRLADLLAVLTEMRQNANWAQFAEADKARYSTLTMVLPQGKEGESVEKGLEALSDLMSLPEARTAVIAFRTDFEAVIGQIDIVADYKQVHDTLHSLEYQCFNTISQAAKLFPDDELSIDSIMEAELTLQQIVDAVQMLAQRPSFATNELVWAQDLARAVESLNAALDTEDAQQLRRAIWLINRVIAIQPSQINTRLNAVARTLRLPALVKAMTEIHESLAKFQMDKVKLEQFVNGAYGLAKLNMSLESLVEGHDDWQAVMLEMRRIETSMDQDPLELEMSWPDLRVMIDPLYTKSAEEWATALKQDIERLEESISSANPAQMKRFFRRVDRRAGERFYRLDIDLRRITEDLRRVGEPLARILQILQ